MALGWWTGVYGWCDGTVKMWCPKENETTLWEVVRKCKTMYTFGWKQGLPYICPVRIFLLSTDLLLLAKKSRLSAVTVNDSLLVAMLSQLSCWSFVRRDNEMKSNLHIWYLGTWVPTYLHNATPYPLLFHQQHYKCAYSWGLQLAQWPLGLDYWCVFGLFGSVLIVSGLDWIYWVWQ